jgi:hypothetical protein
LGQEKRGRKRRLQTTHTLIGEFRRARQREREREREGESETESDTD